MSETVLKILLSEFRIVQITCKKCGMVYEIPIENLEERFPQGKCPFPDCQGTIETLGDQALSLFARAFKKLLADTDRLEVRFLIPDNDVAK